MWLSISETASQGAQPSLWGPGGWSGPTWNIFTGYQGGRKEGSLKGLTSAHNPLVRAHPKILPGHPTSLPNMGDPEHLANSTGDCHCTVTKLGDSRSGTEFQVCLTTVYMLFPPGHLRMETPS